MSNQTKLRFGKNFSKLVLDSAKLIHGFSKLLHGFVKIVTHIQCGQSCRTQIGGSNLDSSAKENFQSALNSETFFQTAISQELSDSDTKSGF